MAEGATTHNDSDPLLARALEEADQGRAPFFLPEGKIPQWGGHGFYEATINPARIRAMRAEHPEYSYLGIATGFGSRLACLDIDPQNGGSVEAAVQAFGPDILTTKTVKTPHEGGRHFYFAPDGPIKTRHGMLPGCDWKADGGYILVPPSPGYEVVHDARVLPVLDAIRHRVWQKPPRKAPGDRAGRHGSMLEKMLDCREKGFNS